MSLDAYFTAGLTALSAAIAAVLVGVSPALAGSGGWIIVPSPAPSSTAELLAVSADSSSDTWGVGTWFDVKTSKYNALAERWNGSKWQQFSAPSPGSDVQLNGVATISPSDAWSVGFTNNSSWAANRTLAEHWNGSTWSLVSTPNPSSGANELWDVSAVSSSDVWAVGDTLSGGDRRTLVERWSGSSWTVVSSPNKSNINDLHHVFANSANDVWAAGTSADPTSGKTLSLLEHWNGRNWSIANNPSPRSSDYVRGIAGSSSSNVWIVGEADDPAPTYTTHTLIEHWDGSKWSQVLDPDVGTISGIAAVSAADAWIVGVRYDRSLNANLTLVEHWDGSSWSVVASPNASTVSGAFNSLNAAARVPRTSTTVWAVGSYDAGSGGGTLVLENKQA
ncbi:MAG: hypothetical protein M3082_07340 [Candidatus Dormibacteraeota bacterium]|nr:hypothetical protein [Candidatus Dormibacteraeota bacterium]